MRIKPFLALVASLPILGGVAQARTFVVTTTADTDDGACKATCSLRDALLASDQLGGTDDIKFASPLFDKAQKIKLTLGELTIKSNTHIDGPDNAILTIDGNHKSRVLDAAGGKISIDDLVFANGNGVGAYPGDSISLKSTNGGCIHIQRANLTLNRCVIVGGVAQVGGGIVNTNGDMVLTNCTIARNVANIGAEGIGDGVGGGVFTSSEGSNSLTNCTVTDNKAIGREAAYTGTGGGIYASTPLSLNSDIVTGNQVSYTGENHFGGADIYGNVKSQGGNVVGQFTGSGSYADSDKLNADALFNKDGDGNATLKDNGGGTLTIALRSGSPALGAGRSSLKEDQRGVLRFADQGTDSGAFEQAIAPVVEKVKLVSVSSADQVTPTPLTPGATVKAQVTVVDPDTANPTLSYVWTRTRAKVVTVLAEKSGLLKTALPEIQAGDILTATVTASDGNSVSKPASGSITVKAPVFSLNSVTLTPEKPYTNDKLVIALDVSDITPLQPLFTYVWSVNGTEKRRISSSTSSQDTLDLKESGLGDRDDLVQVTVTTKGDGTTFTATKSVTILNSAPTVSRLALAPAYPTPTGQVTATYGAQDADRDALTPIYRWRIVSKTLNDETTSKLDLSKYPNTKAGDIVSVEVRVSDGTAVSKTLAASVTVAAGSGNAS